MVAHQDPKVERLVCQNRYSDYNNVNNVNTAAHSSVHFKSAVFNHYAIILSQIHANAG